jgi:radical SAM family uncharacterized protein/radical SAM-linked protein
VTKLNNKFDLEEILENVEKPGRYLGGEWNAVKKDPDRVKARVALAFPDLYEVGMSYLGQKILYSILNAQPDILAERVYAPWKDMEQELRTRNIPLFSLENRIPLDRFDIIGFSLLYELNYSNVLNILDLGQIPIFSGDRDLDRPLVMAGGPAAFNPEPLAQFFDLFLIGDGEEAFLEIIHSYLTLKEELKDKGTVLAEMSKIKGVYVPSLYLPYRPRESSLLAIIPRNQAPRKIKKRIFHPLREISLPEDIVVPHIQVIFDRIAVEVARGCPQNCRFCQASSIYFPYRVKSPSSVIEAILNSLHSTGYKDVSLASLSVSDYPYLERVIATLMGELDKHKVSLSLSSLRPRGLTSEVVKNIVKVRKTGFTLVPEAGTQRLRAVINKCLRDDEIKEAARLAFGEGWLRLKLYFMVGLPTETHEDLDGIVDVVKEILSIGRSILKRFPQINLSLSSFIPKPHTPFQWVQMDEKQILAEKHMYVTSRLKPFSSVRWSKDPLEKSILEGIFSRGDRRLNGVLFNAWKNGARFDSWKDEFRFQIWESAFESENIDGRDYLSALDQDMVLPWDHIDSGFKKRHLLTELGQALKGIPSSSCRERKCEECRGCAFSKFDEVKFDEEVAPFKSDFPLFGKRTEKIHRYRAFYRKEKQARFLSQIAMNNALHQGFRRAGIPVCYSEGFHPKMMMSHLPALPLGMEGKEECIEFKSQNVFSEVDFLSRINKFLQEGIEFLKLDRLPDSEPSINKQIGSFVYSLDLTAKKIKKTVENFTQAKSESEYYLAVKRLVDAYLDKAPDGSLEEISIDEDEGKLYLWLKPKAEKYARPQDLVRDILGIQNPTFSMAREKIVLKTERTSSN